MPRDQNARLSLAFPGTSNTYSSTAPPVAHASTSTASANFPVGAWLPEEAAPFDFGETGAAAWAASHQITSQPPRFVYDPSPSLPPRSRIPLTPSIRVTTEFPDTIQDFSQPQDAIHSASSASSLPLVECPRYNRYSSGHPSPSASYNMPHETPYHIPSEMNNMQAPVSPVSGHNSPHGTVHMGEQASLSRKRSHSVMSQSDAAALANASVNGNIHHQHSRSGSMASAHAASPNDPAEDYSPRGSRAFKRGDAPKNAANKFICLFSEECAGLTFDRKCEWR